MGGGVYIVDVGKNIAGWLKISVRGERGASVTLKFGEQLTNEGYVNQLNLRSARCSDTYILKGDGVEEFAPRFTYHGFRYVQAEIAGKAELLSCVGEHVHTAAPLIGDFSCSDKTLNALHEIAVRTEQNNQHSILTDCPQRDERFGWLNDLGSRIYQTMYNVDMSRFIPKFIRDITHTQTAEGGIGDTAPYYTACPPIPCASSIRCSRITRTVITATGRPPRRNMLRSANGWNIFCRAPKTISWNIPITATGSRRLRTCARTICTYLRCIFCGISKRCAASP